MFFCAQKRFFTIKKHITRILDAYCTVKTERDRKKVNFCQKLQTLKKITPSSGENSSSNSCKNVTISKEKGEQWNCWFSLRLVIYMRHNSKKTMFSEHDIAHGPPWYSWYFPFIEQMNCSLNWYCPWAFLIFLILLILPSEQKMMKNRSISALLWALKKKKCWKIQYLECPVNGK